MVLNSVITNIEQSHSGIWENKNLTKVSYTENGHNLIQESEEHSFWFSHRLESLKLLFEKYPTKTLFDIGGGNGEVSIFLQNNDINCTLIEPGIEGAMNAHKKGVNSVIHASFMELDIKDNSIHAIGLFDVLEHIEKDQEFLNKVYRNLEPNGKLYLTVPALPFLFSEFDKEVGHFRRYTLSELSRKFEKSGFKINYKTYLFSLLPLPILIVRIFYSLIKRPEKRRKFGHLNKTSILGFCLNKALKLEHYFIQRGYKIPIGSSCLVVAEKI